MKRDGSHYFILTSLSTINGITIPRMHLDHHHQRQLKVSVNHHAILVSVVTAAITPTVACKYRKELATRHKKAINDEANR